MKNQSSREKQNEAGEASASEGLSTSVSELAGVAEVSGGVSANEVSGHECMRSASADSHTADSLRASCGEQAELCEVGVSRQSQMDIDILELSDKNAKFVLSGVSAAFTNALRRSIIAEIPIMAIDYVNIYDNTSILYDEQLALRLGLIPLRADSRKFTFQTECSCNGAGCTMCQASLTISAEGPRVVYSGDIIASNPNVYPIEKNVPIVELKERQKIVIDAVAKLGTGRQHAKWQAGLCGYKNAPIITIGEECDMCGKCVETCPRGVLSIGNYKIIIVDQLSCSFCGLCKDICPSNTIKIAQDDKSFVITSESFGSMTAYDLVIEAAETIKRKAEQITKILEY